MSVTNALQRLTSKDLYIEWLPGGTEQPHIQHLYFQADVDGGTFRLRVNGEQTGDITMTGTAATDVAAIQTALDALDALADDEIVVSGSAITDITLTGSENKWYTIYIENITSLTGNASSDANLTTRVTQQGAVTVPITAEARSFSWEHNLETVSVRAISEYAEVELPVGDNVSWDISLFKVKGLEWANQVLAGQSGLMTVYATGKFVGDEYWQMQALITKGGEDFGDHETIENAISGVRQGDFTIPTGSVYKG